MNPEVLLEVQQANHLPANNLRGLVEDIAHDHETEIRKGNIDGLGIAEHSRGRLKVANPQPAHAALASLPLLAALAGRHVEEQVHLPTGQLMGEELDELDNGHILKHLGGLLIHVQVGQLPLVAISRGGGDKRHVLLHVAGETMMAMMAELPAEEGNQKEGVTNPADNVVEPRVSRESTVAALVRQDPDACADQALEVAVQSPGAVAERSGGDQGDVLPGEVAEPKGHGEVPEEVGHGDPDARAEAVVGDGVANGLDVGVFDGVGGSLLLLGGGSRRRDVGAGGRGVDDLGGHGLVAAGGDRHVGRGGDVLDDIKNGRGRKKREEGGVKDLRFNSHSTPLSEKKLVMGGKKKGSSGRKQEERGEKGRESRGRDGQKGGRDEKKVMGSISTVS